MKAYLSFTTDLVKLVAKLIDKTCISGAKSELSAILFLNVDYLNKMTLQRFYFQW